MALMMMRFFTKTYGDSPWVEISPRDSSASARWDPRQWRSWWPFDRCFWTTQIHPPEKKSPSFCGGWLVDDIDMDTWTNELDQTMSSTIHSIELGAALTQNGSTKPAFGMILFCLVF